MANGPQTSRSCLIIAAGLVLAASGEAFAHDSWLVASRNVAAGGETIRLAFISAETFPVGETATDPDRVAEWVVAHGSGQDRVMPYGIEGAELAARIHPSDAGMHVVGLALQPRFIEIEPEHFEHYLADEEATASLAAYRQRDDPTHPGREYYTKHGKTFVEVGDVSTDTSYRQPVGHAIEIVPLSNPCRWNAGDEVLVRVLLEGKPAPGLRVSTGHEGLPEHTYVEHVRTDEDGVARLTLTRPGHWFARTHVIRPVELPDAEWESFWGSITFRVAGDR